MRKPMIIMRQAEAMRRVGWLNPVLFLLFFFSGFCSLVYQVVWLRLAFAHFGIVTPVLSVVLSVFMLGLGAGSLLAGRWAGALSRRIGVSPATLYGLAELTIGTGALAVPAGSITAQPSCCRSVWRVRPAIFYCPLSRSRRRSCHGA
jgi:MFS family permease